MINNNIVLEQMTLADVESVLEIERLSYQSPWPEEAFLAELSKTDVCYYIAAKQNNQVIGYCGVWVLLDEAHITTLAVHPDYRKHGIGTRLLFCVFDEAYKRKLQYVTLEVRMSNTEAKNMYRKFLFTQKGFRRGYYLDNNEDAEIWTSQDLFDPDYVKFIENLKQKTRDAHAVDVRA